MKNRICNFWRKSRSRSYPHSIRLLMLLTFSMTTFTSLCGPFAFSQDETSKPEVPLTEQQRRLANRYRLLEEKLFALYEYEQDTNPTRSKLLKRAYILSQQNGTADAMQEIVTLMAIAELKDAEKNQAEAIKQLESLLDLLQSEDRGKRIRDELQRHQEYLKEVERLLRIEKSLRGQAEGNVDGQRIAKSQGGAADRAKKLAEQIRENEESPVEGEEGEESSDLDALNESDEENSNPGEGENEGESKSENENDSPGNKPSDEGQQSDGEPTDGESTEGQPSEPGEPTDEPGSQSQPGQKQTQQPPPGNPIRERIEAANEKMREAKQKLESADREQAIEAMKEAEREIAAAKKELEEILRQLRGEEVERTLTQLEGRFRRMLERELKVHEQTVALSKIDDSQRQADFEIKAGKLSVEQNSIATEASRALLLLREDGSSIAFPQTVSEMQQDMKQIAVRLAAAKVGTMTIGIEEDVIETLNYLIEALVTEQKNREEKERNAPPSNMTPQQPGDMPLVEQLAELRMLRGLQDRIHRRHTRYANMLDDPEDIIGTADDPDLRIALQRLAQKQTELTAIAREIVEGLNK